MCSYTPCQALPLTHLAIHVVYCHTHQGWHAEHEAETMHADGHIERHGETRTTFGPFTSYTDVQHWLASEARVLKLMPLRPAKSDPAIAALIDLDEPTTD